MNRPNIQDLQAFNASVFMEVSNYITFLLCTKRIPSGTTINQIDNRIALREKGMRLEVLFFSKKSVYATYLFEHYPIEKAEKLLNVIDEFFQGKYSNLNALKKQLPDAFI